MTSKATKFYSDELSELVIQNETLFSTQFRDIFLIQNFDSFDDLVDRVKKDDIVDELISLGSDTGKDITVAEWSPKKLEALHACAVEKGLRVRYKSPTLKDLYAAAAAETVAVGNYMKDFKEAIKFE